MIVYILAIWCCLMCVSTVALLLAVLIWMGPMAEVATESVLSNGASGPCSITFYGQTVGGNRHADDNRLGLTGIDLDAHGKAGLKFKGRPVYAGAVHQHAGANMMYKVLDVRGGGIKPIYIHVVDVCDAKDSICNKNIKDTGFLVDIFATGFKAAGKSDGLLKGTYKVIGEIPFENIPKSLWKNEYVLRSCSGKCSKSSEQKWVKV